MAMKSAKAPSRSTPMIWVRWQRCAAPSRHWRQWPQTMWPSAVTRSPTASRPAVSASRPSSTISPANSWPTTTGGLRRCLAQLSHSQMCRSVPQTPACRTRIRTSVEPQVGLATSRSSIPGPGPAFTRARIGVQAEVGGEYSGGNGQEYKHPRTEVRGRFYLPMRGYARRRARLGGVLGRDPLVPVILGGLFVGRPHISPEPHRLGRGATVLDDDAHGRRGDCDGKCGHGTIPQSERATTGLARRKARLVPSRYQTLRFWGIITCSAATGGAKCQMDAASGEAAASGGHVGLASRSPSGRRLVPPRFFRIGSSSTFHPS